MAFPGFGKKDPLEPGAKRQYPTSLETDMADDLGKAAEDRPKRPEAPPRPATTARWPR